MCMILTRTTKWRMSCTPCESQKICVCSGKCLKFWPIGCSRIFPYSGRLLSSLRSAVQIDFHIQSWNSLWWTRKVCFNKEADTSHTSSSVHLIRLHQRRITCVSSLWARTASVYLMMYIVIIYIGHSLCSESIRHRVVTLLAIQGSPGCHQCLYMERSCRNLVCPLLPCYNWKQQVVPADTSTNTVRCIFRRMRVYPAKSHLAFPQTQSGKN